MIHLNSGEIDTTGDLTLVKSRCGRWRIGLDEVADEEDPRWTEGPRCGGCERWLAAHRRLMENRRLSDEREKVRPTRGIHRRSATRSYPGATAELGRIACQPTRDVRSDRLAEIVRRVRRKDKPTKRKGRKPAMIRESPMDRRPTRAEVQQIANECIEEIVEAYTAGGVPNLWPVNWADLCCVDVWDWGDRWMVEVEEADPEAVDFMVELETRMDARGIPVSVSCQW